MKLYFRDADCAFDPKNATHLFLILHLEKAELDSTEAPPVTLAEGED